MICLSVWGSAIHGGGGRQHERKQRHGAATVDGAAILSASARSSLTLVTFPFFVFFTKVFCFSIFAVSLLSLRLRVAS